MSDRVARFATLDEQREQLRLALDAADTTTWTADLVMGQSAVSENFERLHGFQTGTFPCTTEAFLALVHPDDRAIAAPSEMMAGPDGTFEQEFRMILPSGEVQWVRNRGRFVKDEQGIPTRITGVCVDITSRRLAESALKSAADRDSLTGLPNRSILVDRIDCAVGRLGRRPGGVALLFVDLDRFKVINDGLGHVAGDQLLVAIAERLSSVTRGSDTVARYGGDEFVVLCEATSAADEAQALACRILRAISQPLRLAGRDVVVTASIGIATVDEHGADAECLLRDAGAAMLKAKHRGGARSALFDAVSRGSALARVETESDLRAALESGQLRLAYQPLIELGSGRAIGAEALIRWDHPDRGVIMPNDFIPLAEETGLIVPVGAWVLNEACRQLRAWEDSLGPLAPASLSVNVSGHQLRHGDMADLVCDLLRRSTLDPSSLCLEITESGLMDDTPNTVAGLGNLRDLGVRLSVDDFGTGYSSLLYLRRFPIHELKIDRVFVAGIGRNREDTAIVEGVVGLAHALKLTAVAEGVETQDQANAVARLGCELAQGYYWARPIDPGDLADLLIVSQGAPAGTTQGTPVTPQTGRSRQRRPATQTI